MQCLHCRATNEIEDRRCKRCGRRLPAPGAQAAPDTYPIEGVSYTRTPSAISMNAAANATPAAAMNAPITSATAPAMAPIPFRQPTSLPKVNLPAPEPSFPEAAPGTLNGPVQGLLFSDAGLGRPKVVSLPTLTPRVPVARRKPPQKSQPGGRQQNGLQTTRQQSLDFQAKAVEQQMLESVIYCDAPVALPMHRMIAGAVDGAFTAIACGAFIGLFYYAIGPVAMTRGNIAGLGFAVFCVGALYRLMWALGAEETPGMRFAGLRLVNFDGRKATQSQRIRRQIAYVFSWLSAGLGIVWALVDEESLTWHDHSSKTFPTPERQN